MPVEITEFLKIAGTGGMIFVIFYIYHKSSTEQMNKIITQTFDLLKIMIEQNNLQIGYLQKIDTKITNNLWCPYMRKRNDKNGEKTNEPDNF